MKKVISLGLFIVLAFSVVSLSPRPAAAATTSLADLMPANVALYADLRTTDLTGSINTLVDLLKKADIPVPTNLYAQLDQGLTQALGRPATFEKDVLSWLGDHAAVGLTVTNEMMTSATDQKQAGRIQPPMLAILTVKNETGADTFLKDLFAYIEKQGLKFSEKDNSVGGNSAQVYSNALVNISVVRTKGYLVIGNSPAVTDMIDTLSANKATLGADAKFKKTIGLLKPNSGLVMYVGPRLLQYQIISTQTGMRAFNSMNNSSAATPEATASVPATNTQAMADAYKAFDGVAVAARADGKELALDVAFSINPDAAKSMASMLGFSGDMLQNNMKPLTAKLASQIPASAIAVVQGSGLAQIYTRVRESLIAAGKLASSMNNTPGLNADQAQQGFEEFEKGLQDNLGINLKDDVLSWTGGEFALYLTYDKTGDLAVVSNNQWPFDSTLLIATSDTAKANNFVDKLNTALSGQVGIQPVKMGDNLFSVSANSPVRIGYGVTKDTFILSTGSGVKPASDAVKGGDTLASGSNKVWTNATAVLPKEYVQLWYLDLTKVHDYAVAAMQQQSKSAQSNASMQQGLSLLNEFESAVIYGSAPDATSGVSTLALILK